MLVHTFATCKEKEGEGKCSRETSFSSATGTQKGLDPKKLRNVLLLWQFKDLYWLFKN